MSRSKHPFMQGVGLLLGALALVATSATGVFAKGGPPHPPGEETGTNNLSVPAIFVPSTTDSPFTGTCTAGDDSMAPVPPKGVVVDGVLEHPDYYVQGVTTWQADCDIAADNTLTVAAEWGDNLTNAPLKAGTPIRVEIGFLADPTTASMLGYEVVKLDPTLLDRESHYGTLGVEQTFTEVRVWDAGVTLDIRSTDGSIVVADGIDFSAEINSTGRITYGFNWQNPVAGEYTITVYAPTIALGSTDAGTLVDDHTVTLIVNVGNKGGGGGGKGGRPPGGGPGKGQGGPP